MHGSVRLHLTSQWVIMSPCFAGEHQLHRNMYINVFSKCLARVCTLLDKADTACGLRGGDERRVLLYTVRHTKTDETMKSLRFMSLGWEME